MSVSKKCMIAAIFVTILFCWSAVTSFALSPSDKVESNTFTCHSDDPFCNHGFVFTTAPNGNQLLNQYTSAVETPPGTYLTTWKRTGSGTQGWVKKYSADGKVALVCATNENVAININRANYSRANVYTLVDNYFGDVALTLSRVGIGTTMRVSARGGYPAAYLRVSSTSTPATDGVGTSFYCEWNTSKSTVFYEDDWISARAARFSGR